MCSRIHCCPPVPSEEAKKEMISPKSRENTRKHMYELMKNFHPRLFPFMKLKKAKKKSAVFLPSRARQYGLKIKSLICSYVWLLILIFSFLKLPKTKELFKILCSYVKQTWISLLGMKCKPLIKLNLFLNKDLIKQKKFSQFGINKVSPNFIYKK